MTKNYLVLVDGASALIRYMALNHVVHHFQRLFEKLKHKTTSSIILEISVAFLLNDFIFT